MWIALEAADDLPAAFEPGHVLGLGLQQSDNTLMRHAYTVSLGRPGLRRFEHLYRVISRGRMTPHLAGLSPADEVFFHGPFHTPIQQEVRSDAERVVLISTGAGIGPLFGYAQKSLVEGETRPMTLYAGFREESHVCLTDELNLLSCKHPNFGWHITLSRPAGTWHGLTGRVTESVPKCIDPQHLGVTHFHLVGNGEMVHLMKKALHRAGVLPPRVSIETYFNHHAIPESIAVDELAAKFTRTGNRFPEDRATFS